MVEKASLFVSEGCALRTVVIRGQGGVLWAENDRTGTALIMGVYWDDTWGVVITICWSSRTRLINGRLKGEVRVLQTCPEASKIQNGQVKYRGGFGIYLNETVWEKMTPLTVWPSVVHPVSAEPRDATWTLLGGCLHVKLSALLSCQWGSFSEQHSVGTSEMGWQRQVLEAGKTGTSFFRDASQPRPLVVVVHLRQKARLATAFQCGSPAQGF